MSVEAVPVSAGVASYLEVGEADELATTIPNLAAWEAAAAEAKAASLNLASADVDAAMPYQGRPYDPSQPRQFPRVAEDPTGSTFGVPSNPSAGGVLPAVVWDWDSDSNTAVVPTSVKLAVLFQADSLLAGTREPRLSAQHDGVVYQQTDDGAESYKRTTGPGVTTGLCRRAWLLMRQYRIRGGRLL